MILILVGIQLKLSEFQVFKNSIIERQQMKNILFHYIGLQHHYNSKDRPVKSNFKWGKKCGVTHYITVIMSLTKLGPPGHGPFLWQVLLHYKVPVFCEKKGKKWVLWYTRQAPKINERKTDKIPWSRMKTIPEM